MRTTVRVILTAAGAMLVAATSGPAQEGPVLPPGLDAPAATQPAGQGPALPPGLGQEGPALPPGLERPTTAPAGERPTARPAGLAGAIKALGLSGFWEVRGGVRTQHDPHERQASLGETRLQLEWEKRLARVTLKLTADLLYDVVDDHHTPRLETGEGFLDLREASATFSPLKFMDVKIGRQVLTWGTGDLLFLNDLFPKDWQSFLAGRDVEYLKAPSDAVKLSFFGKLANLDVVFTPRFDADRFITGRRLSYYNGNLGRLAGRNAVVGVRKPDRCFRDHEWACRFYRNVSGYELAGYGYWGYWKSPGGVDAATGRFTFPRLNVYGGSVRGQVGRGIGHLEAAYYDSRDDRDGDNPFVNNSQVRLLAGYEQDLPEVARDLTVGVQYYVELTTHHAALRRGAPPGAKLPDKDRHLLTVRVTKLMMNQNLTLGLFCFYSPTDCDAYLRPRVSYKIDDHWTVDVGGNVFLGRDRHTFFGQFRNNTNLYAAVRYGF